MLMAAFCQRAAAHVENTCCVVNSWNNVSESSTVKMGFSPHTCDGATVHLTLESYERTQRACIVNKVL